MMRPTPHQNYPRGGYSLEGKKPHPAATARTSKTKLQLKAKKNLSKGGKSDCGTSLKL